MSKTRIQRGSGRGRSPARRRTQRRQRSWLDTLFAALPFSHAQIERAMTVLILVALAGAGIGAASFFGLPGMAAQEFAEATSRAGFRVKRVEVRNVQKMNELAVYEIVLAHKDRAMSQVDLAALRRDLTAFGWIADARVSRQLPDTLVVDIVERSPRAAWDNGKRIVLIDDKGVVLEPGKDGVDPQLLRVVGRDANRRMPDLIALLDAAPALTPQVRQAEWIGNRRWNLRFATGELLALPEGTDLSRAALVNFARMEGVNRLLGKGVTYFDMRDPDRAYLRRPKPGSSAGGDSADLASAAE